MHHKNQMLLWILAAKLFPNMAKDELLEFDFYDIPIFMVL